MKPRIGEPNLGAVIGAVVGAMGGLVAIAIPLAILTHDVQQLSAARTFGLIGFGICTPIGWLIGGQISPRIEKKLGERVAGIIGGLLGGLVPISLLALYGWHLITPK